MNKFIIFVKDFIVMKYKVKIEKTVNKFINKFEINNFITNHKNYEFATLQCLL